MMLKTIVICYLALISCTYAKRIDGLTMDLIHRDSPQSPLYDPKVTPSVRLSRSHSRAQRLSDDILQNKNAVSTLVAGDGQYLIRFLVGSPKKQKVVMMIDTGASLVWMECQPCRDCPHQATPTFDPNLSGTYKTVRCNTHICDSFLKPLSECNEPVNTCSFRVSYADNSYAQGEFASDTFTFDSTTPNSKTAIFTPILFGCATENTATGPKYAGIAGLDGSRHSLVSQLGYKKFSYCLVGSRSSKVSKLHFGADADILGGPVSRTPISRGNEGDYYLTLEAFTIGRIRLEYPQAASSLGNILIDSGTPITYLDQRLYEKFERAIEYQIKARAVRNVLRQWRFCYFEDQFDGLPRITVHFKEADVAWGLVNAFVQIQDDYKKYLCLAVFPVREASDRGIYGSIAQTDFKVKYDIAGYTVSFKPQLCGHVH